MSCPHLPPPGTGCRQPASGASGPGGRWSPLLVLLRHPYVQRGVRQEESREDQVNIPRNCTSPFPVLYTKNECYVPGQAFCG